MSRFHLVLPALVLGLTACEQGDGGVQELAQRSQLLPHSQSPELGCHVPATLPPGGITAVDTSLTPRPDVAAEILAMEGSGELVAPDALYGRVVDELAILRSYGAVEQPVGCGKAPSELLVGITATGYQQMLAGEYTAWDSLNAALRATVVYLADYGEYSRTKLAFDGVYNYGTLVEAYGQLPEVRWAEPNGYVGASNDVCLERFGDPADTHVYIFWSGSGDCPAGCISHTYYGYSSEASGALEYLGSHSGTGNEPDWFAKAQQCRNFLYPQP